MPARRAGSAGRRRPASPPRAGSRSASGRRVVVVVRRCACIAVSRCCRPRSMLRSRSCSRMTAHLVDGRAVLAWCGRIPCVRRVGRRSGGSNGARLGHIGTEGVSDPGFEARPMGICMTALRTFIGWRGAWGARAARSWDLRTASRRSHDRAPSLLLRHAEAPGDRRPDVERADRRACGDTRCQRRPDDALPASWTRSIVT